MKEQNQWFEARQLIYTVHENRIHEETEKRNKVIKAIEYLETNDPACVIEFIKDENGNTYDVKFNFNPALQPLIDSIIQTGELPKPIKKARRTPKIIV